MSNLFLILIIAFVVIVLAIACLAIGWLITGKTKVEADSSNGEPIPFENDCQSDCNLYSNNSKPRLSSTTDQTPPPSSPV